jgi:hypothetical protein
MPPLQPNQERLVRHLILSAVAGGWFLVAMAVLLLGLVICAAIGMFGTTDNPGGMVLFSVLAIALLLVSGWLFDYPRRFRALLVPPPTPVTAKLMQGGFIVLTEKRGWSEPLQNTFRPCPSSPN